MPSSVNTGMTDTGSGGSSSSGSRPSSGHGKTVTYTAAFSVQYHASYSDESNIPGNSTDSSQKTVSGNPPPSPGNASLSVTISSSVPVRTGYTFAGWREDNDNTKRLFQPGTVVTQSVSYGSNCYLHVYSRWTIITYSVKYYANGGTDAPSNQTKNYGSTVYISATAPKRDNFIFLGWNTAQDGSGISYSAGQAYSANANLSLYAIWRPAASLPTVDKTSVDIGSSIVITTNRTDPNAVHTINYSFEGTSGLIADNVTTSYTWTIPGSFYSILSTKASASCNISCATYVSGNQIGETQTLSFTVTVPAHVKPTLTVTTTAVNEGDLATVLGTALVQMYSKVSFGLSSTPGTGATFSSYSITGPDLPNNLDNTASTIVTNTLSGAGTLTWSIYAIDSRGRTSDVSIIQANVATYSRPTISPISMFRCDQYGNQNQSAGGTYLNTRAFYSASNVGNNTINSVKVYYRKSGLTSGAWTLGVDLTEEPNFGSGAWTGPFGGGNVSPEYSWEVKYEIQDSMGIATSTSAINVVSYPMPSAAGLSYGIYNDRMRLGGLVEEPGFVVDWSSKFRNVLAITDINTNGIECVITGEGDNMSLLLTGNK